MTLSEGGMLRGILDGPPPLTETDRAIAHGKLLLKALYEPNLRKRSAARRTILLLLGIADGTYDGA